MTHAALRPFCSSRVSLRGFSDASVLHPLKSSSPHFLIPGGAARLRCRHPSIQRGRDKCRDCTDHSLLTLFVQCCVSVVRIRLLVLPLLHYFLVVCFKKSCSLSPFAGSLCVLPSVAFLCFTLTVDLLSDCDETTGCLAFAEVI